MFVNAEKKVFGSPTIVDDIDNGLLGTIHATGNAYLLGHEITNYGKIEAEHFLIAPNLTDYDGFGSVKADVVFVHADAVNDISNHVYGRIETIPHHDHDWTMSDCTAYLKDWVEHTPGYDY